MSFPPVKRRLGRFAFAAAVYSVGIMAFSGWSYITHRRMLLDDIDATLSTGTYAVREMLCHDEDHCIAVIRDAESASYETFRKKLDRFATKSGFAFVGVAVRTLPGAGHLITGSGGGTLVGPEQPDADLPKRIGEMALDLAETTPGEGLALLTTDCTGYGKLRVAAFYERETNGAALACLVAMQVEPMQGQLLALAIRTMASGLFLLMMAVPLVLLYNHAQQCASKELAELNAMLQDDVEGRKERELELKDAIADLERFSSVTSGREMRILELKAEVNALLAQANQPQRYKID
ncbi:hypothetical protein [Pontiella sp.]|uniref:hypothetical protein n=1 Tax=Pontiella sp. TaxID=2837462 RepID=UPI003567B606